MVLFRNPLRGVRSWPWRQNLAAIVLTLGGVLLLVKYGLM